MVDIDKLLELESMATKGLWSVLDGETAIGTYEHDICFACPKNINNSANLRLIVAMRLTFRYFLLEIKTLRKIAESSRDAAGSMYWPDPESEEKAPRYPELVKAIKEWDDTK